MFRLSLKVSPTFFWCPLGSSPHRGKPRPATQDTSKTFKTEKIVFKIWQYTNVQTVIRRSLRLLSSNGAPWGPRHTEGNPARDTRQVQNILYTQKNIALKKRSVVKRMFRLSADGLPAFLWVQYNTARAPWGPRQTERETQDKSKPFQTTKYSWHLKNLGALLPYLRIFFALCAPRLGGGVWD